MKTKMISGLSMLVFNDINKPHRKFRLHYVICSVPQVAEHHLIWEKKREETDCEWEKVEGMHEFYRVNVFPLMIIGNKIWKNNVHIGFTL